MAYEREAWCLSFVRAARVYWLAVFPRVTRELRALRTRAHQIPDPALRAQALEALGKRGNMEGAAAFAAFVKRPHRDAVIRATVAFQAAYNHLDVLSERSTLESHIAPQEHSALLHQALLAALNTVDADPEREQVLRVWERYEDGGYLFRLVERCRTALRELPSYALVAPVALGAATRVIEFQSHQACGIQCDRVAPGLRERGDVPHEGTRDDTGEKAISETAIERWGMALTLPGIDLRWWETAASAGSSLGLYAMIAAAADPSVTTGQIHALEHAYFPYIGALHSMLDHLIDSDEDEIIGQRNLIERYSSPSEAAERMALLAHRSLAQVRALEPARCHELIVMAMACFYLSDPRARTPAAAPIASAILDVLGTRTRLTLGVFRLRRAIERPHDRRGPLGKEVSEVVPGHTDRRSAVSVG